MSNASFHNLDTRCPPPLAGKGDMMPLPRHPSNQKPGFPFTGGRWNNLEELLPAPAIIPAKLRFRADRARAV
jgi:hypothetical protein